MNAIVRCVRVLVLIACACVFCAPGRAEDKPQPKRSIQSREITGELVWKGYNKISVLYQTDEASGTENEMLLPYDEKLIVEHRKSMDEISRGDIVRVTYSEDTIDDGERIDKNLKAVKVSYIKKSGKKIYEAQTSSTSGQSSSGEEGAAAAEPLTLKGAK